MENNNSPAGDFFLSLSALGGLCSPETAFKPWLHAYNGRKGNAEEPDRTVAGFRLAYSDKAGDLWACRVTLDVGDDPALAPIPPIKQSWM